MVFLANQPVFRTMASATLALLVVSGCSHVSRFAMNDRPAVSQRVDPFKNRPSEAIVVAPQRADNTVVQTSVDAEVTLHVPEEIQADDLSFIAPVPSTAATTTNRSAASAAPDASVASGRLGPAANAPTTIRRLPPTSAQAAHGAAVLDFNRAQHRLLQAVGQPAGVE